MLCLIWRSFWMRLSITSLRTLPHNFYINCSENNNHLKPHCISKNGWSPARVVILDSRRVCSDTRERATPLDGFPPCALGSSTVQEIVANQRHNTDIAVNCLHSCKESCSKNCQDHWIRYYRAPTFKFLLVRFLQTSWLLLWRLGALSSGILSDPFSLLKSGYVPSSGYSRFTGLKSDFGV